MWVIYCLLRFEYYLPVTGGHNFYRSLASGLSLDAIDLVEGQMISQSINKPVLDPSFYQSSLLWIVLNIFSRARAIHYIRLVKLSGGHRNRVHRSQTFMNSFLASYKRSVCGTPV